MRWFSLLPLLALLACQYTPPRSEDSPLYAVPAGSRLLLHRAVPVPADRASVHIQGGEVIPYGGPRRYYPYCSFEVWTRAQAARVIQPDEFTVTRVVRDWRTVAVESPLRRVQVSTDDGGGLTIRVNSTALYLRSERQPDVYRLTCEQWAEAFEARHLTIRELRGALGDLFTLQLPTQGSP